MSSSKQALPMAIHPLFGTALVEWGDRAGLLSALPDAPVVPEPDRRSWWRRGRNGARMTRIGAGPATIAPRRIGPQLSS